MFHLHTCLCSDHDDEQFIPQNTFCEHRALRKRSPASVTFLLDCQGFKDALLALALLKRQEMEHQGAHALQDLVLSFLMVRPEFEDVRNMAWLLAKANTLNRTVCLLLATFGLGSSSSA